MWIFHCWYAFQVCFLDPGEILYVLYKILRREILSFNIQLKSTNYTNLEVRISIGVLFSRILILNQIFQKTIEDFSYCFLMGNFCDCELNYFISWNWKQLHYKRSHKNLNYYIFDVLILIFIQLKTLYSRYIYYTFRKTYIIVMNAVSSTGEIEISTLLHGKKRFSNRNVILYLIHVA